MGSPELEEETLLPSFLSLFRFAAASARRTRISIRDLRSLCLKDSAGFDLESEALSSVEDVVDWSVEDREVRSAAANRGFS